MMFTTGGPIGCQFSKVDLDLSFTPAGTIRQEQTVPYEHTKKITVSEQLQVCRRPNKERNKNLQNNFLISTFLFSSLYCSLTWCQRGGQKSCKSGKQCESVSYIKHLKEQMWCCLVCQVQILVRCCNRPGSLPIATL